MKLAKRTKISNEYLMTTLSQQVNSMRSSADSNLLQIWSNSIGENINKNRLEFQARATSTFNQVPLYLHLKLDEPASMIPQQQQQPSSSIAGGASSSKLNKKPK